jgi:hypothetical protein
MPRAVHRRADQRDPAKAEAGGELLTDDHLDSDPEILFRGGRGNSLAELLRYTGEVRVRGATQATSRPTSDSGTSRFQHEVSETQTNSRSLVYNLGHRPAYRFQDTCGLLIRSLPCSRHVRSRRPSDIQSTAGARPAALLRALATSIRCAPICSLRAMECRRLAGSPEGTSVAAKSEAAHWQIWNVQLAQPRTLHLLVSSQGLGVAGQDYPHHSDSLPVQ